MIKLFSYSTLRLPQVMREVLGVDPPHVKKQVLGCIVDHGDNYKDLVAGDKTINGELYTIGDRQLAKLIAWEKRYTLRQIRTTDGELVYYFKMKGTR